MSDYKAEVDENLTLALTCPDGYQHLRTADLIQLAQVNATMHLAEQQRIANLIALWNLGEESVQGFCASSGWTGPWDSVSRQIVEGLGIS